MSRYRFSFSINDDNAFMMYDPLSGGDNSTPKQASSGGVERSHTVGVIACGIYIVSYIALSEIVHFATDEFNKPLFIQVFCGFCYAFMGLLWLTCFRTITDPWVLVWPSMYGGILVASIGSTYTASLHYTAPAVNNTLYTSDCMWVYFLSIAFLGTKWENVKGVGIVICLSGVALISFGNDSSGETEFIGVIFVMISTFLYSIFATYLKVVSDKYFNDDLLDCYLFMGLAGLWHSLFMIPILAVCHFTDVEEFELPEGKTWGYIVGIMVAKTTNYVSSMVSVGIMSPIVLSLCNISVSPLSFVFAVIFMGSEFGALQLIGAGIVCIGVLIFEHGPHCASKYFPAPTKPETTMVSLGEL